MEALYAKLEGALDTNPDGTIVISTSEAGGSNSLQEVQGDGVKYQKLLYSEIIETADAANDWFALNPDSDRDDTLLDIYNSLYRAQLHDEQDETKDADRRLFTQLMASKRVTGGPRLIRIATIHQDYMGLRYGSGLTAVPSQ